TGEDADGCLTEFRGLGRNAQRSSEYRGALRRAQAMADPSRLTALMLLKSRPELCACEIQASLGISHATVSHHMGILLEAGFVTAERRGKWLYYRLNRGVAAEVP
ncbi:MAG: metalloregulator ArsR/SmtB family transcription factor, partial [Thermoplasmata archaeon]|nr:metalloregulator ArsR/SmtB family transcription factor [Thermoplasmata archaeon]